MLSLNHRTVYLRILAFVLLAILSVELITYEVLHHHIAPNTEQQAFIDRNISTNDVIATKAIIHSKILICSLDKYFSSLHGSYLPGETAPIKLVPPSISFLVLFKDQWKNPASIVAQNKGSPVSC